MRRLDTALIVGASLAGYAAARALRTEGFTGGITMVGEEQHRPYDRPPLSKGFLAGTLTAADLVLEDEDLGVDMILGTRATVLDTSTRTVTLADGRSLHGDVVLVATGARARRLPAAIGGDLPGVHTLRTLDDALALRAELVSGVRLVLVGAGFIGAEIASTAHRLGVDVTVVEAAPAPLVGPLGPQIAAVVAGLHAGHGVPLLTGVRVAGLTGTDRVTGVELADGRWVPADVVVVGVGSAPNVEWLTGSGLNLVDSVGGGLGCDAVGAADAPGVFGIGDCSAWFDPALGFRRRVEHWTEAHDRPGRTARAVLGGSDPTREPALTVPYFWSDQYGVRIQFAGHLLGDESVTVEAGTPESADVLAVYHREGRAVAVVGMNQPRLFARARRSLAPIPVAA